MPVAIVILLAVILLAAASFYIPFYSSPRLNKDACVIPTTEQYLPFYEDLCKKLDTISKLPYEQVYTTSHDGLRLAARYYHRKDGAPLKIEVHGYRGSGLREFCGGNELNVELGLNVLLIDQRGLGLSEGKVISFGVNERYDVLRWVEYAVARFGPDVKIVLSGVSMGASSVLMASGLNLPKNVKGIISDCGFTTPEAIIKKVCKTDMHLPTWLIYPFAKFTAKAFGKFDLESASAVEAVKNATVPILLVHGDEDRYVPCSMAYEIHAANPDLVRMHIFPGAGHALSFMVDMPRYRKLVIDFYKEIL